MSADLFRVKAMGAVVRGFVPRLARGLGVRRRALLCDLRGHQLGQRPKPLTPPRCERGLLSSTAWPLSLA